MKPVARCLLAAAAAAIPAAANAQDKEFRHAVGTDIFFSTDAEGTQVVRTGINADIKYRGPEEYLGFRLEKAWFQPLEQRWRARERAYLRAADNLGEWKWNATVGTDGDTVLGSAAIHDESRFRKELFVEREILETPEGLRRGIYYTFVGGAIDMPINDRNTLTLVSGLQEFTGDNVRTHVRANFVHLADEQRGITFQLRTRFFHNSHPREFDYYSPRWYAQAVPIVQIRRRTPTDWRYVAAVGLGVQRDNTSKWRRSSYFNARVESPRNRGWSGNASFLFSETPTSGGNGYNYVQMTLGVTRAF